MPVVDRTKGTEETETEPETPVDLAFQQLEPKILLVAKILGAFRQRLYLVGFQNNEPQEIILSILDLLKNKQFLKKIKF